MSSDNTKAKVIASVAAMVLAALWAYHGWNSSVPGPDINNGSLANGMGFGPRRPGATSTTAERGSPRGRGPDFAELNLTAAQKTEIEKARAQANGNPQAMRQTMEKVLTKEQRQKMRETMESRRAEMDARMKKALSPADYAALERKRQSGAMRPPRGAGPPEGEGPPAR